VIIQRRSYGLLFGTTVSDGVLLIANDGLILATDSALFLASLNVMDYSLVVGVDSERKELVVGVVDYIRTFTW
jgi:hypothetical protein